MNIQTMIFITVLIAFVVFAAFVVLLADVAKWFIRRRRIRSMTIARSRLDATAGQFSDWRTR